MHRCTPILLPIDFGGFMEDFTDHLYEISFLTDDLLLVILDERQAELARSACTWHPWAFVECGYLPGTEPAYSEVDVDARRPGAFDDLMARLRREQANTFIVSPSLHLMTLAGSVEDVETRILLLDRGDPCESTTVEERVLRALRETRHQHTWLAALSDSDIVLYHQVALSHRLMSTFSLEIVQMVTAPVVPHHVLDETPAADTRSLLAMS